MSEFVNIVKEAVFANLEDHKFRSKICKCATYGQQNFGDGYVLLDAAPRFMCSISSTIQDY